MKEEDKRKLLKEFPALEFVVDRVETVNGIIKCADLCDRDKRGLALHIEFKFGGCGTSYSLNTMEDIQRLFEVCDVSSLKQLEGTYVRIQKMSQASWMPFFRIHHIIDDTDKFVFAYDKAGLERFSRGERV